MIREMDVMILDVAVSLRGFRPPVCGGRGCRPRAARSGRCATRLKVDAHTERRNATLGEAVAWRPIHLLDFLVDAY
ncbi:hypothetical protein EVAR_3255_1 [Eumeta japonica]|uniref:Uncharacterized protein n=1 Tax=Eumeta variegata TaxID=151549 RepID=A0A4C1SYB2_EUMVA|nr:hypothetical protein EVAR_3255_1 [Eumeta japonica]